MVTCGYKTGIIKDPTRSNWQNDDDRPIPWSAWYPAKNIDPLESPPEHFFEMGQVALNAPLIEKGELPVVMLSHGTGGTAESLGWLARSLACEGYVVIGANHHGNTGLEPFLAEGFLCWWERAVDLSVLLTSISNENTFAGRLDPERVSAVGFSLGGYSVLALIGAQTSMEEFDTWRISNGVTAEGPKEFPDAASNIPKLFETSEAFCRSWERHSENFTDDRIKSIVAIAPAPPIRSFTSHSIAQLKTPVTILTGSADLEAPSEHCTNWLLQQNHSFTHYDLGRDVGHYTFLEMPADKSLLGKEEIFTDHENIDREKIHRKAAAKVIHALN